jgi:hypothetical protein
MAEDERAPREPRVCAVCGRALDYYNSADPHVDSGWMHTMQDREHEDHPAVPASLDEIEMVGRCDFCNADEPHWVIPAKTFEVLPGSMSNGDWAACDACCELIATRRWESLIRRAASSTVYRDTTPQAMVKASLASLYSRLKKNITGEPYPIKQG